MNNDQLASALAKGDRSALARAITLVESTLPEHQQQAHELLHQLLSYSGKAVRIGITGVPGVGKSTFIEAYGMHAITLGKKVAVLAVDPSSERTGGSILGDKTRMPQLAQHPDAFIRPSPTSGTLGGVARRTRESIALIEAAGFDVVIVETVGVGQSEIEIAQMVDMFMLLLLPGSGDELQGIKRGIVEMADILVVNKADGELLPQAKRVKADYTAAVRILTSDHAAWIPPVELCSALERENIDTIWNLTQDFCNHQKNSGQWQERRTQQAKKWLWKELREALFNKFIQHPGMRDDIARKEQAVMEGRELPYAAAMELVNP